MGEIVRALLALQEEDGWLAPDRLAALAERLRVPLHRLESVSTFYPHFHREKNEAVVVSVCRDLSCQLAGGESATTALREWAEGRQDVVIEETSCLGRCDGAPAAGLGHRIADARDLAAIDECVEARDSEPFERGVRSWPAADPYCSTDSNYRVLRQVLSGSREAPIEALEAAGLRGMGGAGFPTARKWSLVAAEAAASKVVICNADESEPGTFKDRELIHDLPHLLIEGMAIAAYCVGADRGTIFIRHEYESERRRLEAELDRARSIGVLGDNVFETGFCFDVEIFVSPGGYVLGEETALLECLEDRRGEPRNKPPFPGNSGLFQKPTLINNVETLVHAVGIVANGSGWWHDLGEAGFSGHKFMSTSGDVEIPGVALVAVGTKLGVLLENHGGISEGRNLLAVAPGGASSNFLGPEALDLPVDFDGLAEAGTMLGSGAAIFVAEGRDLLEVGLSITRFFRNESCGKCVPCRVGSEKAVSLIEKAGAISDEDEALLRALHDTMQQTSICGLGQVALGPLLSILSKFPEQVHRVGEPGPNSGNRGAS
ncbi:MAG TPA: nitroreductase family protein [Myxococcales bacterium]|nr:nitroreductase family protein [Myxococcales bacterium]HIK83972.1 nitroreductase family protein [Myxococcales bacterium]